MDCFARQRRQARVLLGCGLLFAVPLAGCGSSNPLGRQAVEGKVTLNGAPLDAGSIEFTPLDPGGVPSGGLIAAGAYVIPEEQGLPLGKYRVAIVDSPPAPPLPPGHMPGDPLPPPPKPRVPAAWNTKSDHTVEVTAAGTAQFDFDIRTKGK